MAAVTFLLCLSFLIALACSQAEVSDITTSSYPLGDIRNCPVKSPLDDSQSLYRMEVLPGIGFDNLRNLDMGQVITFNFSNCHVSNDGKYLLPDGVFLIPVHESKVNVYAEYFDHWDAYTSMTSASINLDAGFFSIVNAKYSSGYSITKSHMHDDKAKSTRVQIRNKLYVVKLQPGGQLHPTFKSLIYNIAASIQNNNTEYAQYLSELLVRDYGTHLITSMDAGAILSQTDFIRETDDIDLNQYSSYVKASASANFFGKISLGASFQYDSSHNNISEFIKNRTYSQVVTMGGPPFTPNMTLNEWVNGMSNALVAIDRSGSPLHFVINPTTLPRLPETTVRLLADNIQRAINRYYKVNTHAGCTDPSAGNFNFQANLDNGFCSPINTNFTFGGIFQKCTPDRRHITENLCTGGPYPGLQNNPLTGGLICPPNYTPVLLHSGPLTHVTHKPVCNNVCHHCGLWSRCCHCESVLTPFLSIANYEAYWCAALPGVSIPQNEGYLFGGFYTSKMSNPFTDAMTCPPFFYPVHMGEDIKICVSTDYERGFAYAIEFGGFESCSMGNPLADSKLNDTNVAKWPHSCPHGFAQHLITVEDSCEINFCINTGAFKTSKLIAPRLPPYRKHPKYKINITDTQVVFGVYGKIWVKNGEGGWDEIDSGSEEGKSLLNKITAEYPNSPQNNDENYNGLNTGAVVSITVVITVVLGMIIMMVVLFTGLFAYKRRKSKAVNRADYTSINEEQVPPSSNLVTTELLKSSDENEAVPV